MQKFQSMLCLCVEYIHTCIYIYVRWCSGVRLWMCRAIVFSVRGRIFSIFRFSLGHVWSLRGNNKTTNSNARWKLPASGPSGEHYAKKPQSHTHARTHIYIHIFLDVSYFCRFFTIFSVFLTNFSFTIFYCSIFADVLCWFFSPSITCRPPHQTRSSPAISGITLCHSRPPLDSLIRWPIAGC